MNKPQGAVWLSVQHKFLWAVVMLAGLTWKGFEAAG